MKPHHLHRYTLVLSALLFFTSCSREQNESQSKSSVETSSNPKEAPVVPAPLVQQPAVENPMPGREPLLEKPNFKPAPAPGSSKMDAVARRIQQQMNGLVPGSAEAKARFASLWQSSVHPSFARPVASASHADVAAGRKLPVEASIAFVRDDEFIEAIESGKLPNVASDVAELDSVLTKLVLALGSTMSGIGRLPDILSERANALPPTVDDLATLVAVKQGLREQRSSGASVTTLDDWRPLASAKNPVYRYLALLAAPHTIQPDASTPSDEDSTARNAQASNELLRFYSPYLNETDAVIVEQAIEAVGNLGTKQAKQTLEALASRPEIVGDKRLLDAVQLAIQDCDAMIRLAD